ncbi:MAG: glycosyltransferase family 2 protein [Bacteroidaceae bacterium]|nr:glycosyltransferase family 2 protein [Bacteroidaceae bacterium]
MKAVMIIFWVCMAIVVYTYVGYGFVLYLMIRIKRIFKKPIKPEPPKEGEWPEATLLICAYNEEDVIDEKIANCRALQYPEGKLKVVFVTDGSNDHTNERLAKYPEVEVLFRPERMGKTAALNRAIPFIKTPIVIFTDANTNLNPQAIKEIVTCFQDKKVGCVAGEKRIEVRTSDGVAAGGEGAYWKYESTLKKWDSELCSTMGAAGELFAVRTSLFEPMDLNMLLDDFIMSMRIVQKGYKIAYCKEAYACETGSAGLVEEKKRKVRIAAGGLQSIWQLKGLLNPFKYGIISFQLLSHRFLRWSITPFCLIALIPLNLWLMLERGGPVYITLWALQCVFYILALIGYQDEQSGRKRTLTFIPCYFLFMNLNVFGGIKYLIKKKKGTGAWEKAKRA